MHILSSSCPPIRSAPCSKLHRSDHELSYLHSNMVLLQDAWRPQIEYWQQKLEGAPEMLELPGSAGRPRTSIGRCWKAPLAFNDAQYEAIKNVASICNATPLMLITCALQVR